MGRQLHYSDDAEVRRVVVAVVDEELRFRSVIKQVVLSEMFRRFEETETAAEETTDRAAPEHSSKNDPAKSDVETDINPTVKE